MMDTNIYGQQVSFDGYKAFAERPVEELKKSYWLFSLMKRPWLVWVFSRLTIFFLKIGMPIKNLIRKTIFPQFCGGESIEECQQVVDKLRRSNINSILDYSVEGKDGEDNFSNARDEILKVIDFAGNNPSVPFTSLKMTGIARFALLQKVSSGKKLTDSEQVELNNIRKRLYNICDKALEKNVSVYIDAEESWIQDAIDRMTEELMFKYNLERAVVLTTLQMYRKDMLKYLKSLIKQSKENNFVLGVKLVRGAYWEKENERAKKLNYSSPVFSLKEQTDLEFDLAVKACLENIDHVVLCAGTHNEASTRYLITTLGNLNIPNDHPHVYFSQLYGMSDHITYDLADAGYNVIKYLPYGPVESTIPYLIRRAEENSAISGQMSRELAMISGEMKRREAGKLSAGQV